MKKMKHILPAAFSLLALSTGCEHIIEFDEYDTQSNRITINALAAADTIFTAAISKAYPFQEMNSKDYYDGLPYWLFERYQEGNYENDAVLVDAKVKVLVNGTQEYAMQYDTAHCNYRSDYVPQTGDCLKLIVDAADYPTASAEVEIPSYQQLEILDCRKFYSPQTPNGDFPDSGAKDTIASITMRLTDPGSERNYYRLNVRSVGIGAFCQYGDIYSSTDAIFKDDQLVEGTRGWPAYFSNIFTDRLFNGKQYTFTVESRLRKVLYNDATYNYIIVELQSLTHDLYYYLQSLMYYRITDQDSYSEAVQIYSNVENGFGILGGVNSEKLIIDFRD